MTSSRSYGYGVLEQALAVSAFAVGPWTTAADQCDANYYADGRSAAVQQRQRDHSGALHHRHSQRCQLAALQPDHWRLPRNDGTVAARRPPRTASSAAVRWLWQQRCPHRTAAHPLALPSRQRCVHCCATRSAGAALALHQGQRQSQRCLGAAPATTWRCPGAHTLQNRERIGAQARPGARAAGKQARAREWAAARKSGQNLHTNCMGKASRGAA